MDSTASAVDEDGSGVPNSIPTMDPDRFGPSLSRGVEAAGDLGDDLGESAETVSPIADIMFDRDDRLALGGVSALRKEGALI